MRSQGRANRASNLGRVSHSSIAALAHLPDEIVAKGGQFHRAIVGFAWLLRVRADRMGKDGSAIGFAVAEFTRGIVGAIPHIMYVMHKFLGC